MRDGLGSSKTQDAKLRERIEMQDKEGMDVERKSRKMMAAGQGRRKRAEVKTKQKTNNKKKPNYQRCNTGLFGKYGDRKG